jgi:hypothetical protein
MAYKLEIRPLAAMEVFEAYDWYELQREGLGTEFLEELNAFYSGMLRNPTSYGFVVYSVFMTKQDPNKKRLG